MAIMESLLQTVEEERRSRRFSRIHGIVLEIGPFSGVEVEALRFAFEAIAPGTLAEGAALEIEEPPARGWCSECGMEVPVKARFDPCPGCGKHLLVILGGTELRLKALDVE
ncbi:MAG TPA: hydrogenase maturation nickel metallochaperone HypA [Holophagaceae bacterium]|nr:hydrogenase maturation nickel metallochaperone HypA [Holophagaceae bacterium]